MRCKHILIAELFLASTRNLLQCQLYMWSNWWPNVSHILSVWMTVESVKWCFLSYVSGICNFTDWLDYSLSLLLFCLCCVERVTVRQYFTQRELINRCMQRWLHSASKWESRYSTARCQQLVNYHNVTTLLWTLCLDSVFAALRDLNLLISLERSLTVSFLSLVLTYRQVCVLWHASDVYNIIINMKHEGRNNSMVLGPIKCATYCGTK
jgi:hypothetical protein